MGTFLQLDNRTFNAHIIKNSTEQVSHQYDGATIAFIIATGMQSCKVVVESSSRSVLNLFNFGANKRNVTQLEEYISNEVYKLCSDEEIKLRPSAIKMREP